MYAQLEYRPSYAEQETITVWPVVCVKCGAYDSVEL